MQQLSHPAYMQQQQWPIPPLWYNNSMNMAWPIDCNTMAATQSWQPLSQTNVWNTQQPQPSAQRPMPLPYIYKATAAAQGNHLRLPESDEFVSPPPSQSRPVELTKQVAKLKDAPNVAPESETAAAADIAAPDLNSKRSAAAATGMGTNAPARRGKGNTCVTRGEQCALDALAQIFPGKEFAKVRPDWLINDRTSRALELDLYNHELRLAIEHSGLAHFCFPNRLHKTRAEFDSQVYRDSLKRTLCARAGVLLIEIPFTVPHATMQSFIRSEIDRLSDEHEQEL